MKKRIIEVDRDDIETVTRIEALGTCQYEVFNFDLHNSFAYWEFNGNVYKIYKDSDRLE